MMDLQTRIIRAKARIAELERELKQLEVTAEANVMAIVQVVDGFGSLTSMDVPRAATNMEELLQKWEKAQALQRELDNLRRMLAGT